MEAKSIRAVDDPRLLTLEHQFFGEKDIDRDSLDFRRLWKILLLYQWRILILALLGAIVGYLVAFSETPLYRAASQVVILPEPNRNEDLTKSPLLYYVPKSFYATQQEIIKSHGVLEKVPEKLSESTRAVLLTPIRKRGFAGIAADLKARIRSLLTLIKFEGMVGDLAETLLGKSKEEEEEPGLLEKGGQPDSISSAGISERENRQLTGILRSYLSTTEGNTERIIRISYISANPEAAAEVANIVAETYLEYLVEGRSSRRQHAGEWLATQVKESRKRLTEAEASLNNYQAERGLPGLETVKSISSETIKNINEELLQAQDEVSELSKRYGAKHPALIEARRMLAAAKSRSEGVAKIEQGSSDYTLELQKMEAEVKTNRELYEIFLSRFHEVDLGFDASSSNSSILTQAQSPAKPFIPNKRNTAFFGALWGLALALLSIFFREFFDRGFRTQEDVEERLKLPVLGVLPLVTKKQSKKVKGGTPEKYYTADPKSNFSEIVNHIRTGIIYSNVDKAPQIILLTSALPREGKTTCATNLAQAFSKLGKTLLVDADFRKPRIATIASVEDVTGLTGYAIGQNSLEECMVEDPSNDQLFILRSGQVPPNPLELLSSQKFEQALELMREKFDYIVIDSAPVIPVSDAVVLGPLADVLLMVIKADSTSHNDVDTAMKRLQSARLRPLGFILTQVDYKKAHKYYGRYNYVYKDSYYSS